MQRKPISSNGSLFNFMQVHLTTLLVKIKLPERSYDSENVRVRPRHPLPLVLVGFVLALLQEELLLVHEFGLYSI